MQIDILNSSYSTTRFAFTYAWWSAFGFSRHVKNNAAEAEGMELVDQEKVMHTNGTTAMLLILVTFSLVYLAGNTCPYRLHAVLASN